MIVCATRGGEGSRAVQRAAVQYARENEVKLIFLYVVDESVYIVDNVMRSALHDELQWLGHTLVKLAQQRGQMAGVTAEMAILEGHFRDQLSAYLRQTKPQKLLLGAPRGTSSNIFGDDEIEQFAFEIGRETGVPVQVVRPEITSS